MALMKAKLIAAEQQKRDSEIARDRKLQVGTGDRSERIRTYNFPQGRVTDHRINLTLYKLADIMTGQDRRVARRARARAPGGAARGGRTARRGVSKPAAALPGAPSIAVPSATGVDARIVLAGPGARSFAFVLDWMIRSGLALVYLLLASLLILGNLTFDAESEDATLWYLAGATPATLIYFLYHLMLEPLMAGRTPGKRITGVRVLTPEGPRAHGGRAHHAQRVPHHRFAADVLRRGPAVRVVRQAPSAARRSRGGNRARDRARAIPREARAHAGRARGGRRRAGGLARGARTRGVDEPRRGSDVEDALAVIDDYRRRRARTRHRANGPASPALRAPRSTSRRCIRICTTPSIAPRAGRRTSCCR